MIAFMSGFLSIVTAAVSALALYHSQSSIPKLTKYEGKIKKAAEWSNTAEKQLWDTRYTVGAGFVAAAVSLLTAFAFVFTGTSGYSIFRIVWAAALAAGQRYAAQYMSGFWDEKFKVPLMDDYNEAISDSKNVIGLLDVLTVGWATVALFKLLGL